MSFLDEYDTLDALGQVSLLRTWLASKSRELFSELRIRRPVFASPIGTFVTKYHDVLDVLDRKSVFTVEPYAPKMQRATGPFILGEGETPLYQRDVSALRLVFRQEDLAAIKAIVGRYAEDIVQGVFAEKRLDIVSSLTRLVPTRLVAEYFGVPGPDEPTLMRWARTIFRDIFINLGDDSAVREAAIVSAGEFRQYLDLLIKDAREGIDMGNAREDHILARLLYLKFDDNTVLDAITIRHNLIGLIVGAIDTTSTATAQLIDTLLSRPEQLQQAQRAVAENDEALLSRYVLEALRFNPQAPFLTRLCKSQYTFAKGTIHETEIQPGTIVFASTLSAMFDPDELDSPEEFRTDRPDYHYLHFGYGLHTCFGRYINLVQIPEIVKIVLRLPNLRRSSGDAGVLKYDGPFPQSMFVDFD